MGFLSSHSEGKHIQTLIGLADDGPLPVPYNPACPSGYPGERTPEQRGTANPKSTGV